MPGAADVFVSIHVNWISRRDVRPVETYHVGPTDDPAALKLAGAENRDSGYSLGAYRRLLEKIYIDERRDESRALARAINAELYRALSAVNPGLENRGVKMAPFAVLVGTEMPAILVEVSCLSNDGRSGASHDRRLSSADRRGPAAGHPLLLEGARRRRQEGGMRQWKTQAKRCVWASTSAPPAARSRRPTASGTSSTATWAGPSTWWRARSCRSPSSSGREALDNRSMLDLRRPLERGVIREGSERDEEAVLELLRHLMGLVGLKQKGKARPKVRAVVGVPAEAFRVSRQRLRGAMDGLADSVMLVSEPFAVAYGLEALLHAMIIDIGAGTADLCIMQGRYPAEEDQRTLPDAGDAIDEQLAKVIRERHPEAQFSIHMIREWKERWSFVGEPKRRAVVTVPVKGKATELDITDEMRAACESIVPAHLRDHDRTCWRASSPSTSTRCATTSSSRAAAALIPGLPDVIDRALVELGGGRTTVVKDPIFAGSDGGLAIARDATSADWEKLSL